MPQTGLAVIGPEIVIHINPAESPQVTNNEGNPRKSRHSFRKTPCSDEKHCFGFVSIRHHVTTFSLIAQPGGNNTNVYSQNQGE